MTTDEPEVLARCRAVAYRHDSRTGRQRGEELERLRRIHHSRCMFNGSPFTRGLEFTFRDNGTLTCLFTLNDSHMGYDGMAHGGVIAAIMTRRWRSASWGMASWGTRLTCLCGFGGRSGLARSRDC